MTDKSKLREIAGKALADPDFRQKLLADPVTAVSEAGYELTTEQIEALKDMNREQLEQGLTDLDERLTMACWTKVQIHDSGIYASACTWN